MLRVGGRGGKLEAHQGDDGGAGVGQVVERVGQNGHAARQGSDGELRGEQQHVGRQPGGPGQPTVGIAYPFVVRILRTFDERFDKPFRQHGDSSS